MHTVVDPVAKLRAAALPVLPHQCCLEGTAWWLHVPSLWLLLRHNPTPPRTQGWRRSAFSAAANTRCQMEILDSTTYAACGAFSSLHKKRPRRSLAGSYPERQLMSSFSHKRRPKCTRYMTSARTETDVCSSVIAAWQVAASPEGKAINSLAARPLGLQFLLSEGFTPVGAK
jgi:hypothetical protein